MKAQYNLMTDKMHILFNLFCRTLYSCAPPTLAPVGYERKRRKKKMIQGRYAVRRNGDDDDDDDGGGGVANRHEVAASLVSSSEARAAAAAIRTGGEHKCKRTFTYVLLWRMFAKDSDSSDVRRSSEKQI